MMKNLAHHQQTKHIAIKYHFIKEATKEIQLNYYSTKDQITNIFMKALPRAKFEQFWTILGVIEIFIKEDPTIFSIQHCLIITLFLKILTNINNAFLNGLLEDVYMAQPPGFNITNTSLVCKLHKAIYGPKQTLQAWYDSFTKTLLSFVFLHNKYDPYLLNGNCIYMLIYMDNIIIAGINYLHVVFAIKQLGDLHFSLGIEVKRPFNGNLLLTWAKYITDLLQKEDMASAKGICTPLPRNLKLSHYGSDYWMILAPIGPLWALFVIYGTTPH
ncbi:hypothetical protein CR513_08542, partial [Mucuna pruriens]